MTPWYDTRKPLDTDGFEHRHPLDYWEKELASMPVKQESTVTFAQSIVIGFLSGMIGCMLVMWWLL